MTVGVSACRLGFAKDQTRHSETHKPEALPRPFALAQVGVCDEERLPGEGGGHPVISHHQVKRCHVDQQLRDGASLVESRGLRYPSECEPGHFSKSFCLSFCLSVRLHYVIRLTSVTIDWTILNAVGL